MYDIDEESDTSRLIIEKLQNNNSGIQPYIDTMSTMQIYNQTKRGHNQPPNVTNTGK